MAEKDKKYYWLKLKRDFFKRHDIKVIEHMPNGEKYLIFYLKLLLESIDHEGALRFSEKIPYDVDKLSIVMDTEKDIVKDAMKLLVDLDMMDIHEDQTIYMKEVENHIGSESWSAERVRRHRSNKKALQGNTGVTQCNEEIELEKEIDIELEKEGEKKSFSPSKNKKNSNPFLEMLKDGE